MYSSFPMHGSPPPTRLVCVCMCVCVCISSRTHVHMSCTDTLNGRTYIHTAARTCAHALAAVWPTCFLHAFLRSHTRKHANTGGVDLGSLGRLSHKLASLQRSLQGAAMAQLMEGIADSVVELVQDWREQQLPLAKVRQGGGAGGVASSGPGRGWASKSLQRRP